MFLYNLRYKVPMEKIEALLPAHLDYLDGHYQLGHFICSGRKVPRVGGVILVNLPDLATAQAVMEEDPFFQNGVADYELIEFTASKYAEAFAPFVQGS